MNRIKTIKCLGAAAVLFAGLFATSAAVAGYGHGYGHGKKHKKHKKYKKHYKDDDDDHHGGKYYKDDDDDHHGGKYYKDDDDDHHGGGSYKDDDDDYHGGGSYKDDDDDHHGGGYGGYGYGHDYSDLGIHDLTFSDLGGRLVADATITGLDGASAVQIDLEATSDVSSNCGEARSVNDPLDVQSQGSRSLTRSETDTLAVRIETDDSADIAGDLVSCPGSRLAVEQVEFLDARIDVTQGDNVLTLLCTFATPTADGPVDAANVECWAF